MMVESAIMTLEAEMSVLAQRLADKTREENVDNPEYQPELRPPATAAQIRALEDRLGFALPPSYKAFLEAHDGMTHFQGTHLLFGSEDHQSTWAKEQERFFRENDATGPFDAGAVPVVMAEAETGIFNFWAFDPHSRGPDGELEVVDWDNGEELDRYPSFKAFIEAELADEA